MSREGRHGLNMTAMCLVLLLLLGVSTADDICATCHCRDDKVVDCTNLNLKHHFNNTDWNATEQTRGVKSAFFDDNDLVSISNFTFSSSLQKLSLSGNRIARINEGAFILPNLRELDLSKNQLKSNAFHARVFEGLPSLRMLDLGYNSLHLLPGHILLPLSSLEVLMLDNNNINFNNQETIDAICSIERLKVLSMSYNYQKDGFFEMNCNFSQLEEIHASGMNLAKPPHLGGAFALEVLILDDNRITTLDDGSFGEMTALETLSTSYMPSLKTIEAGALGRMPELKDFLCHHNPNLITIDQQAFSSIHSDGNAMLDKSPSLTKLEISYNALTKLDRNLISNNPKGLKVEGNPWLCDCTNPLVNWAKSINAVHPENVANIKCAGPSDLAGYSIASPEVLEKMRHRCPDNQSEGRTEYPVQEPDNQSEERTEYPVQKPDNQSEGRTTVPPVQEDVKIHSDGRKMLEDGDVDNSTPSNAIITIAIIGCACAVGLVVVVGPFIAIHRWRRSKQYNRTTDEERQEMNKENT